MCSRSALVGFPNLLRIHFVKPIGFAYFGKNVVVHPLERVPHVAVLFDLPVKLVEIVIDEAERRGGRKRAHLGMLLPVDDVGFGGRGEFFKNELLLDDILHAFNGGRKFFIERALDFERLYDCLYQHLRRNLRYTPRQPASLFQQRRESWHGQKERPNRPVL